MLMIDLPTSRKRQRRHRSILGTLHEQGSDRWDGDRCREGAHRLLAARRTPTELRQETVSEPRRHALT